MWTAEHVPAEAPSPKSQIQVELPTPPEVGAVKFVDLLASVGFGLAGAIVTAN
jgi:hypothetical protein